MSIGLRRPPSRPGPRARPLTRRSVELESLDSRSFSHSPPVAIDTFDSVASFQSTYSSAPLPLQYAISLAHFGDPSAEELADARAHGAEAVSDAACFEDTLVPLPLRRGLWHPAGKEDIRKKDAGGALWRTAQLLYPCTCTLPCWPRAYTSREKPPKASDIPPLEPLPAGKVPRVGAALPSWSAWKDSEGDDLDASLDELDEFEYAYVPSQDGRKEPHHVADDQARAAMPPPPVPPPRLAPPLPIASAGPSVPRQPIPTAGPSAPPPPKIELGRRGVVMPPRPPLASDSSARLGFTPGFTPTSSTRPVPKITTTSATASTAIVSNTTPTVATTAPTAPLLPPSAQPAIDKGKRRADPPVVRQAPAPLIFRQESTYVSSIDTTNDPTHTDAGSSDYWAVTTDSAVAEPISGRSKRRANRVGLIRTQSPTLPDPIDVSDIDTSDDLTTAPSIPEAGTSKPPVRTSDNGIAEHVAHRGKRPADWLPPIQTRRPPPVPSWHSDSTYVSHIDTTSVGSDSGHAGPAAASEPGVPSAQKSPTTPTAASTTAAPIVPASPPSSSRMPLSPNKPMDLLPANLSPPLTSLDRRAWWRAEMRTDPRYGRIWDILPRRSYISQHFPGRTHPPRTDTFNPPRNLSTITHPFHPALEHYTEKAGTRVYWLIPVQGPVILPGFDDPITGTDGRPWISSGELYDTEIELLLAPDEPRPTTLRWTPALLRAFTLSLQRLMDDPECTYGLLRARVSGAKPDPHFPFEPERELTAHECLPTNTASPVPVRTEAGDHIRLYCDASRAMSLRLWLYWWDVDMRALATPEREGREGEGSVGADAGPVDCRDARRLRPFHRVRLALVGPRGEVLVAA